MTIRPGRFVLAVLVSMLAPSYTTLAQPAGQGRYYVEFTRFGPEAAAAVRAAGGTVVHQFPDLRAIAAQLPAAAAQALRNNPIVAAVEEDPIRVPFSHTVPYGIVMVQADSASDVSESSVGNRKICVIDSGYYNAHQDLQTSLVTASPNPGTGDPFTDRCGHGTHVAGTIAALSNTVGVEGVIGNGGVNLHIVKVFGDSCSWTYSSDLVAAANACESAGSHVISMSLGGSFKSRFEESKFNSLYSNGLISVAAAGNAGNMQLSYPASYSSVISVGAIDSNKVVASFSQKNSQVELAAPGVGVLSTVPWLGASVTVDDVRYPAAGIEFAAASTGLTQPLVNGGLCTSTGAWAGSVVLCERGTNSFYQKVQNVQNGGGAAAIIYNNVAGSFTGTLGSGNSSAIPAISISQADGQFLVANKVGTPGTVVNSTAAGSGYEPWDGTSMAAPHVAAVAALIWSHNPGWSNTLIREALQNSAEDLGTPGRDNSYGFGLARAKAALDYLSGGTPAPPPPDDPPTPEAISLSASGYKVKGIQHVDLTWSGAAGSDIVVYRDGTVLTTTTNDGSHTVVGGKGGGTFVYRVCEVVTATCSNEVTVTF